MSYQWRRVKIFSLKALLKNSTQNSWSWIIPSKGMYSGSPGFNIESDHYIRACLEGHEEKASSEAPRIISIDQITFSTVREAQKMVLEVLSFWKEDVEALKIVELVPMHPTYKESQVLWYQEY